jgi:hypothetical protein
MTLTGQKWKVGRLGALAITASTFPKRGKCHEQAATHCADACPAINAMRIGHGAMVVCLASGVSPLAIAQQASGDRGATETGTRRNFPTVAEFPFTSLLPPHPPPRTAPKMREMMSIVVNRMMDLDVEPDRCRLEAHAEMARQLGVQ